MPGLLRQIIAKATAYRSRYFQSAASELGFSMETAEKLRTDSETSHIVTDSMIAQGHAMEMNLYLTDVAVIYKVGFLNWWAAFMRDRVHKECVPSEEAVNSGRNALDLLAPALGIQHPRCQHTIDLLRSTAADENDADLEDLIDGLTAAGNRQ